MTKERITEILKEANVLWEGHFLLASGRHSDQYMQCANIFRNTKYSEALCQQLAEKFADENVELVIGPAIGAIQMAYEVSRHLNCENFFAERDEDGKMTLRRGFQIKPGQRILLVEDVVTTGGSVKEVVKLVRDNGGEIIGIGSIVDRSAGKADFDVPYKAVYEAEISSWEADECPLCKEGNIALVKPGSSKIK